MTTETNRDKQSEPRPLSETELDAVAGGTQGSTLLALSLYYRKCLDNMLPGCPRG
jgi:hypothetical protein